MSENDTQVGGDHYVAEYQHWDFIEEHGLGYIEGVASKYIVRWQRKGQGLEDLKKAMHYLRKLVELTVDGRKNRGTITYPNFKRFCEANKVGAQERDALLLVFTWHSPEMLSDAVSIIHELAREHFPEAFQSHLTDSSIFDAKEPQPVQR